MCVCVYGGGGETAIQYFPLIIVNDWGGGIVQIENNNKPLTSPSESFTRADIRGLTSSNFYKKKKTFLSPSNFIKIPSVPITGVLIKKTKKPVAAFSHRACRTNTNGFSRANTADFPEFSFRAIYPRILITVTRDAVFVLFQYISGHFRLAAYRYWFRRDYYLISVYARASLAITRKM